MRETSSEGNPSDWSGRGRRRGMRSWQRLAPCGALHRAEVALGPLGETHPRPRDDGCQTASCRLERALRELNKPRSGCIGTSAMRTPMDCKDFNVLPSGWETSCTVREVLRMPSRHLVVSSSPQFTLIRHKSQGATSTTRMMSGQSLQTHSGIALPGHPSPRACERTGRRLHPQEQEREA